MSTQVQQLRGTTADNDVYTAPTGALTADTEAKNLRLHDSTTPGGFRVAGSVIMDRVLSGTNHTVIIKGAETQVIWSSATVGTKTTILPTASALNDGRKVGVATTLANGDSHIIAPTSGNVQGAPTFTFTDNPRANVSLISDGVAGEWLIT